MLCDGKAVGHNDHKESRVACNSPAVASSIAIGHRAQGTGLTIFGIEAVEDVDEEPVNDIHDLAVVLVDGHLEIQASELAQMAVSEGVLCPAGQQKKSQAQEAGGCGGVRQGNEQSML